MDREFLQQIGKIWTSKDLPNDLIETDLCGESAEWIIGMLTKSGAKSILITGDSGVGKTTLIQLTAQKLLSKGWVVFYASAANVMAGQRYIGDLEQQVKVLVGELTSKKKCVWIVPGFQEMYYTGRHNLSPISILDHILPAVESGNLKVIGEMDSGNLEKIIQYRPQILGAFELTRIAASDRESTLDIAKKWIQKERNPRLWHNFSTRDIEEVYYLANQYLSLRENPGCLMDLLRQTRKHAMSGTSASKSIKVGDFIESLSNKTGLPRNILDDDERLDLEALKAYFSEKVIGQNDAVRTLVERIAMIKAGLTDPTKPAGVFLFVGPTGTGKTEIAKALADYLFGSEERLIRLDMSEFQTADSTYKILGDSSDTAENSALVNRIRRNPFSIVLLDEFEKAHPNIWDFFLQVFDDGRLTDQRGGMADFRHCIIIMTSNLGASVSSGPRIGFNSPDDFDVNANVIKSIYKTFRPEFINRIDKVVVFNPLTRSVAKRILENELKKILKRRGLRSKSWEIEFDDSALEFLLEKGFTSTMGARPLKRAIESYLLAPLAITIVNHNFPKGNQFLLVSTGKKKLRVEFYDPDEPDVSWEQKKQVLKGQEIKLKELSLQKILLDPKGLLAEFRLIDTRLSALKEDLEKLELEEKKSKALIEMAKGDFWERPDRYTVLSDIEYMDRLENAFGSTVNLFERLNDPGKERLSYDPGLISKLAQRIYLLRQSIRAYIAGEAQDAIMMVRYDDHSEEFGKKISAMYKTWAASRGMKAERIKGVPEKGELSELYAVSGFGAYSILKEESGFHVFEIPEKSRSSVSRYKVKVVVIPMELEDHRRADVNSIQRRLRSVKVVRNTRRYTLSKSPIVKDIRSNWQSGLLNRVLDGDFDLFGEKAEE